MCDTVRLYGTVNDTIVDGPGLRYAVFTQGCAHGCRGCHNPASHDMGGGTETPIAQLVEAIARNPLLRGITLSGGEPFLQAEACAALVEAVRGACPALDVWAFSGYTYEVLCGPDAPEGAARLLRLCDVLVDGPYVEAQRSLSLLYRGSGNQRLIDLRRTFAQGEVVLWEPEAW